MTNPPHGDPEPSGRPPAGSPPYGPPVEGPHPEPRSGDVAGGPPYLATQPYEELPAASRPPGTAPSGVPGRGVPGPVTSWPPPDRRRGRAGLLGALVAVVLAVAAGLVVLAVSTGPTVLSRAAVERDVAAQFELREGVAVDLRCGQEMTVEEGATYECTGVTADDERVTLRIEITDEDAARYTWSEP